MCTLSMEEEISIQIFGLVEKPEGYEIKGLAYPGREKDYDANSNVPTGFHNGRTIFYIFGRIILVTHLNPNIRLLTSYFVTVTS